MSVLKTVINLQEILDKKGVTLNREGYEVRHDTGYQVALNGSESILPLPIVSSNKGILLKVIRAYAEHLINHHNTTSHCIGVWVDDNKVYVDISRRISDNEEAFKEAKQQKQKAVYSWRLKRSLKVNDNL